MAKFNITPKAFGKKKETIQPIDDYNQTVEKANTDLLNEMNEFEKAFKESMQREQNMIQEEHDSHYYFCAYFADVAQRDEFLHAINMYDKLEANCINGEQLAVALNVPITKKRIRIPNTFVSHKSLSGMIRPLKKK
jgi:hypothetical protein